MAFTSITDWHPHQIRMELLRCEVSQADIARKCEVTPSMVTRVIDGLSVSARVRQAIAEAIGIDVKRIWPSSYFGPQRKRGRPAASA